jgi:integrase
MAKVVLTDRFVSGAKAGDYFDANIAGLNLRVTTSGVKSWFLLFTSPKDGKRARLTLGRYPKTPLARARTLALEAQRAAEEGTDPRDLARANGALQANVSCLIESYLGKHVRPNLRSAAAIERRFTKNVTPIIGSVALADLHKREINRVIDPILERKRPVEAARCFEDLRALFRWGVARGDLDHSPMDGMRKPAEAKPRERVLTDPEIKKLWCGLETALPRSTAVQRIIRLCLITGQRVGEVSGMHANEIDLTRRLWTIPSERSKNKHSHGVPLTDAGLEVIGDIEGVDYLFPNDECDGPLPAHAVAKTITKAQERFGLAQWTAHDLRRTVLTKMGELGIAPIVRAHVVNHRSSTRAGVTLGVYDHHDYAREKTEALQLWAERLEAIVAGGASVVSIWGRA